MKYYLSTRTYLTAYLMYRTRLLFKISGRQMHKHFQMKQSTYAKVETGALKLTLDNFFNSVMAMYFTLGEFEEFIKKIEEICLENNIHSIKIDTHKENLSMQKLLKKNNFSSNFLSEYKLSTSYQTIGLFCFFILIVMAFFKN